MDKPDHNQGCYGRKQCQNGGVDTLVPLCF